MDTRGLCNKLTFRMLNIENIEKKARIDSCELFSVILFMSKGDYETTIGSLETLNNIY
jgi:hypothetical protein